MPNKLNQHILTFIGITYSRKRIAYFCSDGELFLTDHQINLCRDEAAVNRLCNSRFDEVQQKDSQT